MDLKQILDLPEKSRYIKLSDDLLDLQRSISRVLTDTLTNKAELIENLAQLHVTLSIMVAKGDISQDYLKQATELFFKKLDPEEISKIRELCVSKDCHLRLVGS